MNEVDVANLALSHIGDEAGLESIDPADGSTQSGHAGRFYPMARDLVLEMHPWTFAVKRAVLAPLATNPADGDWAYAYRLPVTCIRPLAAGKPGVPSQSFRSETDDRGHPYIVEATDDGERVLYTNVEVTTLRYIDKVTDLAKFTPGAVHAIARLLASFLAGPIIKGSTGMTVSKTMLEMFIKVDFPKAAAADANTGSRSSYETRIPSFLGSRMRSLPLGGQVFL